MDYELMPIVSKCVCGANARVRYKIPVFWVECGRKCGMKTGYHTDKVYPQDLDSKAEAILEWNRMVTERGREVNVH